jgi:hypothetical protein
MKRDELLRTIAAMPAGVDMGIQIGDDYLDIAEVVEWGDGEFCALRCHPNDLRDVLAAWGLPGELRARLAPGPDAAGPS